ncbi:TrmB family transcriptional regulator [Halobacterium noricense]|uniref:TrmB family transcriptional regulator n=1 Tax=Halobacterium noricense TaxID=223182 RepID=UPI001E59F9D7|nr:TrmB family transcriptional regulator [Halobacterium noricense]UHH26756.1 TrmB family transcriptional regulator [Halobacterium noricense]
MDEAALHRALERAGLTTYQVEAYLTLLEVGTAPAVEVGRNCSVPVSQIYDVLRDLEEAGYVETMDREKLYARPTDPDAITADLQTHSEQLADAAETIEDRYEQPQLMDHKVAVTARAQTAVDHAVDLVEEADHVVEVAAREDQLAHLQPALEAARERGAVVRASVYTATDADSSEGFDPSGAVSELRGCPISGPFLVVIDRDRTCFAPNARADESYGVLIRDRILPFIVHWYFLTCLWNTYPSLYRADDTAITYVTVEEFIRDWYDYWTDDYRLRVAVHGVDVDSHDDRTVTGTVSGIHYLGADSRASPRLADLASVTTLNVETEDGPVSIGGWGAVFEDVELRRIDVLDVTYEQFE